MKPIECVSMPIIERTIATQTISLVVPRVWIKVTQRTIGFFAPIAHFDLGPNKGGGGFQRGTGWEDEYRLTRMIAIEIVDAYPCVD